MLRDKTLIPLSHQHQHALALCVRIERASPIPDSDLAAWQAEIAQLRRSEIELHFAAEEQIIFPAAHQLNGLASLVDELITDHAALRALFTRAEAANMSPADVHELSRRLAAHIRKEERQLFERMQEVIPREQLDTLGARLADALKASDQSCLLPSETTKLKPAKNAN
jgi:iron-sulfur cluster repair protein YtfE (RIC family)